MPAITGLACPHDTPSAHGLRCAITSTPDKAPTHPCAHSTPNVASRCLSLSTRDIRACPGTTPDYLHVCSSDVCRCCGCSIDCPGTTTRPPGQAITFPRSGNHAPPQTQRLTRERHVTKATQIHSQQAASTTRVLAKLPTLRTPRSGPRSPSSLTRSRRPVSTLTTPRPGTALDSGTRLVT